MIDDKKILPLAAVPDGAALGLRVHICAPSTWGEWDLAGDVWLDQSEFSAAPRDACVQLPAGARP